MLSVYYKTDTESSRFFANFQILLFLYAKFVFFLWGLVKQGGICYNEATHHPEREIFMALIQQQPSRQPSAAQLEQMERQFGMFLHL